MPNAESFRQDESGVRSPESGVASPESGVASPESGVASLVFRADGVHDLTQRCAALLHGQRLAWEPASWLELAQRAGDREAVVQAQLQMGHGWFLQGQLQQAREALLERIGGVGDVAVAVGLGEAVDVADLARAELHNAHDLLRR
ncbi:MAG: hypothetical protein HGB17_03110, partial [Syntrophobacteraceae bacterium]|nr:hypothetical protein [Syntrophobacteraceae bacterium]